MGWEQARPSRPAGWAGYVLPLRSGGGSACRSGRGGGGGAGSAIGVARALGVVWDTTDE
jgi:hypothetical protein